MVHCPSSRAEAWADTAAARPASRTAEASAGVPAARARAPSRRMGIAGLSESARMVERTSPGEATTLPSPRQADVEPSGRSSYVTEGVLRASHRRLGTAPYDNLDLPWHRS